MEGDAADRWTRAHVELTKAPFDDRRRSALAARLETLLRKWEPLWQWEPEDDALPRQSRESRQTRKTR